MSETARKQFDQLVEVVGPLVDQYDLDPTFENLNAVVVIGGDNRLSLLDDSAKGKVGVYVFKNITGESMYIGKGASKGADSNFDLKNRIGQELLPYTGNDSQTLSKNIQTSDISITPETSIDLIRSFSLNVISTGDRFNEDGGLNINAIHAAEVLELFLISFQRTRYNRG